MTSLHADEAFLGHYQFSHDPFAPRVPGFKFFPAQRKPVLGQLHHLARYSQLLLLVTGPLGSGKTLLRQALVASTNKDAVLSVVISARTAADETSLLRQVAQGLSINQASLEAILTKVAQLAITGQDVYLMVDDAEQLQDSALEVLLLLASGTNEGRLHVFLFGEPSLLPRLEVFSEGEERFHAIELQPYSEEETRDYLAQRLEGAGQGIELISNDLLVDIHEQSEGWPGAINQVARDALIEAMLANRGAARKATGGSFNLPKKHLVILAVVAIGVIAAWFMQGKSKPEAPQNASTELSMNGAAPAQAQPPGSGPAVEFNGSSQPLPLPLVGESQPVIREPLAQAAGQGSDDEGGLPSAVVPPTVSSTAPPVTPLANNGVTPMHPVPPAPAEPVATPAPVPTPAPAAPRPAPRSASRPRPPPRPSRPPASRPPPPRRNRPRLRPPSRPAVAVRAASGIAANLVVTSPCRSSVPAPKPTPRRSFASRAAAISATSRKPCKASLSTSSPMAASRTVPPPWPQ
ncbi:hypothetical protein BANRA_05271 [Pseudomonas aeruginosa]|nr:hypothetical protein BANRA_05271 [Pseudomonas aeruginosa]